MIKWSGVALIALGVLHMIVLGVDGIAAAPGWFRLEQWTMAHWQPVFSQPPELLASGAAFWATVGSFAIPTIILGVLIVDLARREQRVPAYVGWALLVWLLVSALIIEPSGFPIGVIVAVCLLIGIRKQRKPDLG